MDKEGEKNKKDESRNEEWEKALAKASPKTLLKLKKKEIGPSFPPPVLSDPVKLVLIITIIDFIIALLLTVATGESHFLWLGGRMWFAIPWWVACLDGVIFIGYGIYVIEKKQGQLDISPTSRGKLKTYEITGEPALVLGLIYILLGVFLTGAVVVRALIKGVL